MKILVALIFSSSVLAIQNEYSCRDLLTYDKNGKILESISRAEIDSQSGIVRNKKINNLFKKIDIKENKLARKNNTEILIPTDAQKIAIIEQGIDSGHLCRNFPKIINSQKIHDYIMEQFKSDDFAGGKKTFTCRELFEKAREGGILKSGKGVSKMAKGKGAFKKLMKDIRKLGLSSHEPEQDEKEILTIINERIENGTHCLNKEGQLQLQNKQFIADHHYSKAAAKANITEVSDSLVPAKETINKSILGKRKGWDKKTSER